MQKRILFVDDDQRVARLRRMLNPNVHEWEMALWRAARSPGPVPRPPAMSSSRICACCWMDTIATQVPWAFSADRFHLPHADSR